jgi:uncharacterized protein (TIGR02598 family)
MTPLSSTMSRSRLKARSAAFSLVEVALSIGIVSFAMTAIFGLLPVGLDAFRDARTLSVESAIAQKLAAEVQGGEMASGEELTLFFDNQGVETTEPEAVFVARVAPPVEVKANALLAQEAPVEMVLISISSSSNPEVNSSYPVIVVKEKGPADSLP